MSLEHDMKRMTRDEMLMGIAMIVAGRGTCSRLQVGAVISREGRTLTLGYNGAPAGLPHCDHFMDDQPIGYVLPDQDLPLSSEWRNEPGRIMMIPNGAQFTTARDPGCQVAEHAERNAIAFAAKHGVQLDRSELHVTHAPCLACARTVINAGIERVVFAIPYRKTEGVELLARAGLEVLQINDL